jgi:microcystin-dependent protein
MKKILTTMIAVAFATLLATAQFQDQKGFNFQGYARDEAGAALGNKSVQVRYSLYPAGQPGTVDYTETHSLTTDPYGIFSAVVGSKSVTTFAKLPFSRVNYWLKVEVKTTSADWSTINEIELLSVPYARTAGNGVPVGTVIAYAGAKANIPLGYLICDGTLYNKADYKELSDALAGAWGGSSSQFNVPDMRGLFLRGVSETSGRDDDKENRIAIATGGNTGNTVGTLQNDEIRSHDHGTSQAGNHSHSHNANGGSGGNHQGLARANGYATSNSGYDNTGGGELDLKSTSALSIDAAGAHTHTITKTGGAETRPENVAVYYIIKY